MASSGKKKTTMAKLNRERRLSERRLDKRAKKEARKQASAHPPPPDLPAGEAVGPDAVRLDPEPDIRPLTDA
jgi:hypothetical protein